VVIMAIARMTPYITTLIAHALDTDQRWCHFRNFCLFAVFLVLAIVAGITCWLFYFDGLQHILHVISTADIPHPGHSAG